MPGDYRDLNFIDFFTKITGTLINITPLRVGAGGEAPIGAPVDVSILRVKDEPYIPGSSLKGIFRSFVETLAKSMNLDVHTPFDFDRVEKEEKEKAFCEVCGIFGNTQLASHIRIYDAYPKGEARTFLKTGVAIDREFGGAKGGLLFTEELVLPGVEWEFRVDIHNIEVYPEAGDARGRLLRELFERLKEPGLQVGARKTVGCGLVKLREAEVKVYRLDQGRFTVEYEGKL